MENVNETKNIIGDTYEITCTECGGSGCSFCNDTGKMTVVKEEKCPVCSGNGYVTRCEHHRTNNGYFDHYYRAMCTVCNGTGRV